MMYNTLNTLYVPYNIWYIESRTEEFIAYANIDILHMYKNVDISIHT